MRFAANTTLFVTLDFDYELIMHLQHELRLTEQLRA